MVNMKITRILLVLSMMVSIIGCQAPPKTRTVSLQKPAIEMQIHSSNSIKINQIKDVRPYNENIGFLAGSEILADDLSKWVKESLQALEVNRQVSNTEKILINMKIKKLYVKGVKGSLTASIVLNADYIQNNKTLLSKNYRGSDCSLNWNSSDSEIVGALRNAIKQIMLNMANDINGIAS